VIRRGRFYIRGAPRNFYEKAGNARWRLLAYPSLSCIQTMQNGKVEFTQFPIV